MISSSRSFTILKCIGVLVAAGWVLSYLGFARTHEQILHNFQGEKARFIGEITEKDIDGPLDGGPISAVCSSKTWTKGLVFYCDPPAGGIGEVRNAHLNCIRLAIEVGAELILPEVVRRKDNIDIGFPDPKAPPRGVRLEYLYDREHLNRTLSTFCPQMRLYDSIDDLYGTPMGNSLHLSVQDLGLSLVNDTIIEKPGEFAGKFSSWLNTRSSPETRTSSLVRVNLGVTLYAWPTLWDPSSFVRNFGRILRFREDTRKLAASVLYKLEKKMKPYIQFDPREKEKRGFVGIHLRTESDVWGANFPSYETQAASYMSLIGDWSYPIVYLASGATADNITAFSQRAADFNITVLTKKDLLDADELQYLHGLSFDQMALVDYEVMLRANMMAGLCESAFSWNVALRRASSLDSVGGATFTPVGHMRWQDTLSVIVGEAGKNANMQLSIWP